MSKLDFTIHGEEVWVENNRYWGNLSLDGGKIWCVHREPGVPSKTLYRDGTWGDEGSFTNIPGFLTEDEAIAFADKFRDQAAGPANFERLLGKTFYTLLASPTPPDNIRGLILARLKVWIPESETDLVGWLNANYKPVTSAVPTAAPRPRTDRRYSVEASYAEVERGTCSYSQTNTNSGRVSIPEDELENIVSESDGDRDVMVEAIEEYVRDHADGFDCTEISDFDTTDCESHDYDHREDWEFENIQTILDQYLADHPPADEEGEVEDEPEEEIPFEVGQRLTVTECLDASWLDGKEGTVAEVRSGGCTLVFDEEDLRLHEGCRTGLCRPRRCWWIHGRSLTHSPVEAAP